jgi:hypothetical protein
MIRFSFAEWLQIVEADNTKSGLAGSDFTGMSLADRMAQGRDIGEPFIKRQLAMHGIRISGVPARMDKTQKVDGMWNGDPIQIKLRRSGMAGRNDIAFEVCRNHDKGLKLSDQLKNVDQQGRDYKGQVKHYFVMNQAETEIYHIPASAIKAAVNAAIAELDADSRMQGYLTRPFTSSNQTELRPTQDKDPASFTPFKVMAFIPVDAVVQKAYPIQDEPPVVAGTPHNPLGHTPPPAQKSDMEVAAEEALRTGQGKITIKSSNPKNIEKKMKEIRMFASSKKLKVQDNGDGTVTLIKWPS